MIDLEVGQVWESNDANYRNTILILIKDSTNHTVEYSGIHDLDFTIQEETVKLKSALSKHYTLIDCPPTYPKAASFINNINNIKLMKEELNK